MDNRKTILDALAQITASNGHTYPVSSVDVVDDLSAAEQSPRSIAITWGKTTQLAITAGPRARDRIEKSIRQVLPQFKITSDDQLTIAADTTQPEEPTDATT